MLLSRGGSETGGREKRVCVKGPSRPRMRRPVAQNLDARAFFEAYHLCFLGMPVPGFLLFQDYTS